MTEDFEIWKDIPGYEGIYYASNTGKIMSLRTNPKILNPKPKSKYKTVALTKEGVVNRFTVHSLIALTYLNHKTNHKLVIDHINEDSHDNRLCNLQLITQSENLNKAKRHRYKNGTIKPHNNKKKIYKMNTEIEIIKKKCDKLNNKSSFVQEIAEELGLSFIYLLQNWFQAGWKIPSKHYGLINTRLDAKIKKQIEQLQKAI